MPIRRDDSPEAQLAVADRGVVVRRSRGSLNGALAQLPTSIFIKYAEGDDSTHAFGTYTVSVDLASGSISQRVDPVNGETYTLSYYGYYENGVQPVNHHLMCTFTDSTLDIDLVYGSDPTLNSSAAIHTPSAV
ncbi:acid phosphatase pho5 [Penicillium atrosanguineum]|uniref:acid phosphatase pho5 n=1 Tax=Penicillium atrosanguineum TaxID=1132637 RepID=UPI00238A4F74|nr:acid phosphatase pho5 [Penicillium atrosanguineum]KAJ5296434.1 acid phosphatase pho5 [Penicillium atrosanguineum]